MDKLFEYRGVSDLVAAEIIKDDAETFETDNPFEIAGVSEIGKSTEASSDTHYYDNVAAVVIESTGKDTIQMNTSAIPLDTLANITGQDYDETTGTFIEGERTTKYFALGYKTKKTNGKEVYVWRLKGTFSIPDSTHKTEDEGTEANGQTMTYTGISTVHEFAKTGKRARAVNTDLEKDLVDVSTFFDEVQTPDTLKAKTQSKAPAKANA